MCSIEDRYRLEFLHVNRVYLMRPGGMLVGPGGILVGLPRGMLVGLGAC